MIDNIKPLNELIYPPLQEHTLCSCLKSIALERDLIISDLYSHLPSCDMMQTVIKRGEDCKDFGRHHRFRKPYSKEYLQFINGLISRCETEKQNAFDILSDRVDVAAFWTY